jgi:hypothetical protein
MGSLFCYEGFDYPDSMAEGTLLTNSTIQTNSYSALGVGTGNYGQGTNRGSPVSYSWGCLVNRSQSQFGGTCIELPPGAGFSVANLWRDATTATFNGQPNGGTNYGSANQRRVGMGFWIKFGPNATSLASSAQVWFMARGIVNGTDNTALKVGEMSVNGDGSITNRTNTTSSFSTATTATPTTWFDNRWHWFEVAMSFTTNTTYYQHYVDYFPYTSGSFASGGTVDTYLAKYFFNDAATNFSIFIDDIIFYNNNNALTGSTAAGQYNGPAVFPIGRQRIFRTKPITNGTKQDFINSNTGLAPYQTVTQNNGVDNLNTPVTGKYEGFKFQPLPFNPDKIIGYGFNVAMANTLATTKISPFLIPPAGALFQAGTVMGLYNNYDNATIAANGLNNEVVYATLSTNTITGVTMLFDQYYTGINGSNGGVAVPIMTQLRPIDYINAEFGITI